MNSRLGNIAIPFIATLLGTAFFVSTTGGAHETGVPPCTAIQNEVRDECARMQENQWYEGGAVDYLREDRLKDSHRCNDMANNVFHFCSNPP